jgi:hypothetical protein
MLTRKTEIRMNDKAYQTLIKKARKLIFRDGKKVTSKNVSDLLKDQSLAPILVSNILILVFRCSSSLLLL